VFLEEDEEISHRKKSGLFSAKNQGTEKSYAKNRELWNFEQNDLDG